MRRARSLVSTDPLGAARLRLLEAEILILSQREDEGLALVVPGLGKESAGLAAREAMLTGMALRRKGNWPAAKSKLEWALAKAHDDQDRRTEVKAGVQLGAGFFRRHEWDAAIAALQRAAAVAAQLGDAYLKVSVRFNQASLLMRRGEPDRSTELYKEVVNDLKLHPNQALMARSLDDMAQNYLRVGDYERALDMNALALAEFNKLNLPTDTMQARGLRGRLLAELDRPDEGAAELEKAVRNQQTIAYQIILDVQRSYLQYRQACAELEVLRAKVRPEVEAAIRRAQGAYQEGNVPIFIVLETTRQLLDNYLREAILVADLRRFWAELERSVGRRLATAAGNGQ